MRVLVVCTANICRSPIAATLLAAAHDGLDVSSAGTHATPGRPIDDDAAAALAELGHDARAHRATRLSPVLVENAELILTATVEHRRLILTETPRAIRRTFTLREFARLTGDDVPTSDGLPGRVAEVAARRGLQAEIVPGQDDVEDPFRAPYPVVQRCAHDIDTVVRRIAASLTTGLAPGLAPGLTSG